MADPEAWQQVYKITTELRQRILAKPLDARSSEALIEIACQLIELNQSVADLTDAVQAVADAP